MSGIIDRMPTKYQPPPAAASAPVAPPAPVRPPIDPVIVNAVLIAVRQAADVLCDRWTLLILLAAHCGVTRFADFRAGIGIGTRLLGSRLAMLEEQEVIVRLAYSRRPLRHGYHLTHMGLALFDVFTALLRWQTRWHGEPAGGPVVEHLACGGSGVATDLRCAACGGPAASHNAALKINQKGVRQMPERATAYRRSPVRAAGGTAGLSEGQAEGQAAGHAAARAAVPLPDALAIFGDKWSIELVMCAFVRVESFSGFEGHTGIAPNILADRLARLTTAGVLQQPSPGTGAEGRRSAYRLTAKGRDLLGVLTAIESWADTWLRDRSRAPTRLLHMACGQRLRIPVLCGHCGKPLQRADCLLRTG